MDGVAKEGRPKFNPRPGRGLNPGPSGWQSEILPTVPTSHTPREVEPIKSHLISSNRMFKRIQHNSCNIVG